MKKKTEKQTERDELRREYDLSNLKGGVRGKYIARYRAETNLVLLSPDVAKHFPNEQAVNTALRSLIRAKGPARRALSTRSHSPPAEIKRPATQSVEYTTRTKTS